MQMGFVELSFANDQGRSLGLKRLSAPVSNTPEPQPFQRGSFNSCANQGGGPAYWFRRGKTTQPLALSIHQSTNPSIHQSTNPLIHQSTNPLLPHVNSWSQRLSR